MPQPLLKINEIFYSIQGEGRHTGMPAVFVRLSGCSMGCPWCDTQYAQAAFTEMSPAQIVAQVQKYPCKNIIITGGEPTEQDLLPLLQTLKQNGYQIHLETNGYKDTDVSLFDFITVSPKRYVSPQMLQKADVIKLVVGQETDLDDLQNYFAYHNQKTQIYLQPESNKQENIDLCVKIIKQNPFLRLSLQTHKMANIR